MAADLFNESISMTYQAPLIASALFWILAACALILKPRWAIVCVLLILQFDMSGPGFESTSSVGFENALKIILLPAILLWRIGWRPVPFSMWPRMAKYWMALVAYAVAATAWSDYPLSAFKMIGYLLCSTMLFIVFRFAWSSGWITEKFFSRWPGAQLAWPSFRLTCWVTRSEHLTNALRSFPTRRDLRLFCCACWRCFSAGAHLHYSPGLLK